MTSKMVRTNGLVRLRRQGSAFLVGVLLLVVFSDTAQAPPEAGPSLRALYQRVNALEILLESLSLDNNGDWVISGINVRIQSGEGATNAIVNGTGNLIIGYDEDFDSDDDKSGSHNLVIGPEHSYTSYGGLVAGSNNAILAPYASVSGGQRNMAEAAYSSVSGGACNTANGGHAASVSGGENNMASECWASVSGGRGNMALGLWSSVSGGSWGSVDGTDDWRAGDLFQDE